MAVDESVDLLVQRLAQQREGRLTTGELRRAGLTKSAIEWRVRHGFLTWVSRGVYAVGNVGSHRFGAEAQALAAAGPRSMLTGASALHVYGVANRPSGDVQLLVVGRRPRHRPGVRVGHAAALAKRDARTVHGLAVTSPARALLDYAATASRAELETAIDEGRAKKLLTPAEIQQVLARYPGRRGAACLKIILADELDSGGTRSRAERKMRALLDDAGLPRPQTNVYVGKHRVDAVWHTHRLIIEFDGFGTHGSRSAFEDDRERDRELAAAGYIVLRVTWRQLTNQPVKVIAQIAAALAHREGRAAAA